MLGSVGVVLGSGLLAWPVARLLREDARTFVPPMMFNNCGNMGLPLAALAFGARGFSAMVALFTISQPAALHARRVDHRPPRALREPRCATPMVWSTFAGFAFALVHPPMPDVARRRDQDDRRRADPDDAAVARRAAHRRRRREAGRLGVVGGLVCPLTGPRDGGAARAGARSRRARRRACCSCSAACRRPCSTSWSPSSSTRSRTRSRRSC